MKNQTKPQNFIILALITLLIATLACSFSSGDDNQENLDLQQTLTAMQQTQTALENQITEQESQIEQPNSPLPTEEVVEPAEIVTQEPDYL